MGLNQPVSHVIDVRKQFFTVVCVADERAEFRVFDGDHAETQLVPAAIVVQRLQHAVEADLRRIRYVREKRMVVIVVDGVQDFRHDGAAEGAPFTLDVRIVSA